MARKRNPSTIVKAIAKRGLTIYDAIEVGDPDLWLTAPDLESLLNAGLSGLSVAGLPNRTRSKLVKKKVCETLGYPV